jgi:hypothetical protein
MTNEATTVLEWWGPHNVQHRIQIKQRPGSAHWSILKESRGDGGSWGRDWAKESRSKPTVLGESRGDVEKPDDAPDGYDMASLK